MMSKIFVSVCFLGIGILSSCNKYNVDNLEEFKVWYSTADFLQITKEINGVKISVQYLPPALINPGNDSNAVNSDIAFVMWFSVDGHTDVWDSKLGGNSDYFDRLAYINTSIESDLNLIVNEIDTLQCALVHLERRFGIGGSDRINLLFDGSKANNKESIQSLRLIYDDQLFALGRIKFNYSASDLSRIPTINQNKNSRHDI